MKILLVNDDGIHADGLLALHEELSQVADVTVVAPVTEKSGASSSLTIHTILKTEKVDRNGAFFGYAVYGTPVDCTKLALQALMPEKPDYVFSGINRGPNLSVHVTNSGTVSAAAEAFFQGIPAVAVSLYTYDNCDYRPAAIASRKWLEMMHTKQVPQNALYNINVPGGSFESMKGFKTTHLSRMMIELEYERRLSPRGDDYFWVSGIKLPENTERESDLAVIHEGWISVTPILGADRTDYNIVKKLSEINGVR